MDEAFVLAVRHLRQGRAVEDSAQYLVGRFQTRLIAYFRHHSFSDADAEDLVQETFRRVLTGIRGLNDESKFMPWLFQIARNVRFSARAVAIQRQEEPLEAIDAAAEVISQMMPMPPPPGAPGGLPPGMPPGGPQPGAPAPAQPLEN